MAETGKYIIIGTKIAALLIEYGMSRPDLALKIGVSEATVHFWVNGLRRPDRANATKLGQIFNKPREFFEMPDDVNAPEVKKILETSPIANQYDILSIKIGSGYFDVIKMLTKLRDEEKISEETFNNALNKLDK